MQPDPIGVGNLGALVVRVGLDAVEADAQRAVALIDQQIGADEIGRAQHAAVGERDLEARAVDLKRLDLKRLDLKRLASRVCTGAASVPATPAGMATAAG